jgi:hypothetical protein
MDMFHLPDKSCYIDVKFDDFENHSCRSNTRIAAPILLAGCQHEYEEALYFTAVAQHPTYWRRIGLIAFWVPIVHIDRDHVIQRFSGHLASLPATTIILA